MIPTGHIPGWLQADDLFVSLLDGGQSWEVTEDAIERAAILEFDGGRTRLVADFLAAVSEVDRHHLRAKRAKACA